MTIAALHLAEMEDTPPGPSPSIVAEPIAEPQFDWPTVRPVVHQPAAAPAVEVQQIDEPKDAANSSPISAPAVAVKSVSPISPSTRPAVSFCGVTAQAKSVVFVIDCSASMGLHGRLQRALTEVETSLHRLPADTRFQVIAYHRAANPLRIENKSGLVLAQPTTIEAATTLLQNLRAEGSADHSRAMHAALAMKPDVIYFLTDEDDFTKTAAHELTRANAGHTSIHTICLVAPVLIQSPLAQLASHNRGTFIVLDQ
jgi:hypothetical protein